MIEKPHPTYYYEVYRDFTFKKVAKSKINSSNYNILFIVETTFDKNYGPYTYSTHDIYDRNLKPTDIKIGNIKASNYYYETLEVSFCATIEAKIYDGNGNYETVKFNHANGNVRGKGINSIIKLIKLMNKINEYGGWQGYNKNQEFKIKIIKELFNKYQFKRKHISDLVEEDFSLVCKILRTN